ncbi:COG3650 family protein [Desertivirga arenae]|uniref:COG3650 family protein n=1 Tax=Desertivirga arenae TaxID=2810309 RepID=UPI001A964D98|nr:hypothetical protein [Pedobacter sp. SYSU D00823]
MRYLKPFYFSIALAIMGCKSNPNPPGTIAALNISEDTTYSDTAGRPSIINQQFAGRYLPVQDNELLIDCSGKIFILNDENELLKSNYQKNQVALSYSYESSIAKISGIIKPAITNGRDTIIVSEVKEVKPKSFDSECYNYEFIALGTEPFWSLEIIPDENIIAIKDVAAGKAYRFSYRKPQISDGNYLYKTSNDEGTAEITIKKENCNDGMSDRNYKYSAIIVIGDKPLSGCAIKKGDKL